MGTKGKEAEDRGKVGTDFNFEENLASFDKTDESHASSVIVSAYSKDDFFDSLSCDITDKQVGNKTRMTASEERSVNLDTFGAIGVNSGRGRYRGGRGRGYRDGHDSRRGYHGQGGYEGRGSGGRGSGGRGYEGRGSGGRGFEGRGSGRGGHQKPSSGAL
jgi:hypothetical protein